MEKRGKFIVIEGIDGCGKSSQIPGIADFFLKISKYTHVLVTREPYKTREIRKVLREDNDPYTQAEKLAELFVNDRKEHVKEIILPSLNKGIHVISDRYKFSTIAYQSAQGVQIKKLIEAHKGLPIPDMTIIIDVPVDVAIERMSREERYEHKFEANKEFLEKVRQNLLKMPEIFPDEKIIIIDGSGSIEKISKEIKKILKENFSKEDL